MPNQVCRLYVYGSPSQLWRCAGVLIRERRAFYFSLSGALRVKSRNNDLLRKLEIEFRAVGARTRRVYD